MCHLTTEVTWLARKLYSYFSHTAGLYYIQHSFNFIIILSITQHVRIFDKTMQRIESMSAPRIAAKPKPGPAFQPHNYEGWAKNQTSDVGFEPAAASIVPERHD